MIQSLGDLSLFGGSSPGTVESDLKGKGGPNGVSAHRSGPQ